MGFYIDRDGGYYEGDRQSPDDVRRITGCRRVGFADHQHQCRARDRNRVVLPHRRRLVESCVTQQPATRGLFSA